MRSTARWILAGVVTLAVFSAALCVSAALVLPLWIKSDSDRWAVATSLSVALAAVAALWGAAFAQRADGPDTAGPDAARSQTTQGTTPFLAEHQPKMSPAAALADDQTDPAAARPETAPMPFPSEDQPGAAKAKPEAASAPTSASSAATSVTMHGEASGHGRVYQAAHDQIINEK